MSFEVGVSYLAIRSHRAEDCTIRWRLFQRGCIVILRRVHLMVVVSRGVSSAGHELLSRHARTHGIGLPGREVGWVGEKVRLLFIHFELL